jgi:hypothetical protein
MYNSLKPVSVIPHELKLEFNLQSLKESQADFDRLRKWTTISLHSDHSACESITPLSINLHACAIKSSHRS